jgi:hypothetical protein
MHTHIHTLRYKKDYNSASFFLTTEWFYFAEWDGPYLTTALRR